MMVNLRKIIDNQLAFIYDFYATAIYITIYATIIELLYNYNANYGTHKKTQ